MTLLIVSSKTGSNVFIGKKNKVLTKYKRLYEYNLFTRTFLVGTVQHRKKLRGLLPNDNVVTPDIPVSPIKALQLLLSLAGEYRADDTIVIGTSMGAMYASQMKGYRRILVNPAFHVSDLLKENNGERLQFFSEREDGSEYFEVSEILIKSLKKWRPTCFMSMTLLRNR